MLIPYTRPRGAVHDLQHLLALSEDRCILMCLSERDLYVLQNWLALDIEFESRYALTLQYNGYEPLDKESPLWPAWLDWVRQFQIGARDMSCNIETGLEAIAASLLEMSKKSCCGGGGYPANGVAGQIAGCYSGLTNEQVMGPAESEIEPGLPPPGFATWEEYQTYKCQASEYIYRFLVNVWRVLEGTAGVELTVAILAPLIVGLAGLLPAAFTPVGFAAFIAGCLAFFAIAAVGFYYVDQGRQYLEAHHQEVVCALYQSGSSAEAIGAVAGITEDAIQAITFGGAAAPFAAALKEALGAIFAAIEGNGLVEPLFKLVVTIQTPDADCSGCGGQPGDCSQGRIFVGGLGNGDLSGSGPRAITTDPTGTGCHGINIKFGRGTCARVTSQTGLNVLGCQGLGTFRWYRCQGGEYIGPYKTTGDADGQWSCAGQLVVMSTTPGSIVLDIGADDCGSEDNNCLGA